MALPRSTPLAQGVDARGLLDLLDAAERDDLGLHSLVVARHGHAVAAGWCFTAGIFVFSGSLYALALTGVTILGAITPIGGVAFLAGWILLAVAAF